MDGETTMLLAAGSVLVMAICLVAAIRAVSAARLRRLVERYDLTDEQVEALLDQLPEVEHAIAGSLEGRDHGRREIREMALESTLRAVLTRRRPVAREAPPAGVQTAAEELSARIRQELESAPTQKRH